MTRTADPRLELYRQLWPEYSRSSLYEWMRASSVAVALIDAGLLDDRLRDRQTGRRVKTLIRELGRLRYESDADAVSIYVAARDEQLDRVKLMVRLLKSSVQTLDDEELDEE